MFYKRNRIISTLLGLIVCAAMGYTAPLFAKDKSLEAKKLLRTKMTVNPMDLNKEVSRKDLISAGQMGGHLFPTAPEEQEELQPQGKLKSLKVQKANKRRQKNKQMRKGFAKAIQAWNKHEYKSAYKDFKKYMQQYPDSPWAGEAELHMACEARYNGRYSEAESTFKSIIEKYASKDYDGSRMLADKAKSRLAVLKQLQNNPQESAEYFKDLKENSKDWRLRTYAANSLIRLGKTNADADKNNELLDCGLRAMAHILKNKGRKKAAREVLSQKPIGDKGQNISELQGIATKYALDLTAIRIDIDQLKELPLPAIAQIDNKQGNDIGHYWIIEKVEDGIVTLRDQQIPRRFQQTEEEFSREWSGNILAFAKADALPGRELTQAEKDDIFGGCCGVQRPTSDLGDNGKKGDCSAEGAPVWSVNPINMNLYMKDIPLWYQPEYGPSVKIRLSYNSQSAIANNEIFGNKWIMNYSSYIVADPGGSITIFMPDGRRDVYTYDDASAKYVGPVDSRNKLERLADNHYKLTFVDGSLYEYNIPQGTDSIQPFLVKLTDMNNLSLSFGYNAEVQLQTVTDATGKVTTIHYYQDGTKAGLVEKVVDPFLREATFDYDENDNLTRLVDMGGYWTEIDYDDDVYPTALRNPKGEWGFYIEPTSGSSGWSQYPAPGGGMWENYRITITNPEGGKEEYFYDGYDMRRSGWYISPKNYIEYVDEGTNNKTKAKKTWIDISYLSSYGKGVVSGIRMPEGETISYTHYPDGRVNTITDSANRVTTYTYTDQGMIDTITYDGKVTDYDYDTETGFNLETVTSPVGVISIGYDANNRPETFTDLNQEDVVYTYNSYGKIKTVTDQLDQVTTYYYNSETQQLEDIKRGEIVLMHYTYDDKGRVRTTTDASDYTLIYDYNNLNSLTKITYPDGQEETFSYQMCPRLMHGAVGRGDRGVEYTYDSLKRLIRSVNPAREAITYEYDANSNLQALIDSKQNKTTFEYDDNNRIQKKIYADETEVSFNYANDGSLDYSTNARGIVKDYAYYPNGALHQVLYSDDTPDVTFIYDDKDRLEEIHDGSGVRILDYYPENSKLKSIDGPWDNDTVTYTYDLLGRVKTKQVQGGELIEFGYDGLNRLDWIKVGTDIYDYAYEGNSGLLDSLTMPNGAITGYDFNNMNQLELLSNKKSNQQIINEYGFQYNNRDLLETENRTGALPYIQDSGKDLHTNNNLNQLKQKNTDLFDYDLDGNLTKGYTPEGYEFVATYDAENRLKQLTYTDGSGVAHKKEYLFNSSNLLVKVLTYENDQLTDELRIVRAGFLALQDRDGANNVIRQYHWGMSIGGGIGGLLSMYQGGQKYFYHYDARGNVTAVTDEQQQVVSQYLYSDYGQLNNQTGTLEQPFQFSTKRYDSATGLVYYGYRFYVPENKKWLNRDPIGENGGINLYGFVGGNPVGFVDPLGLTVTSIYDRSSRTLTTIDNQSTHTVTTTNVVSGNGIHTNNPGSEGVKNSGPLPAGTYLIGNAYNKEGHSGDNQWYRLYGDDGLGGYSYHAIPVTDPYGNTVDRGQFNLHTGTRSDGCVTVYSDVDESSPLYPTSKQFDELKQLLDNTTPLKYKTSTYRGILIVK